MSVHRGQGRSGSASTAEVVCAVASLVALGAGIIALAAGVWPRTATVVVIVSYAAVCWMLARGVTAR